MVGIQKNIKDNALQSNICIGNKILRNSNLQYKKYLLSINNEIEWRLIMKKKQETLYYQQ